LSLLVNVEKYYFDFKEMFLALWQLILILILEKKKLLWLTKF
jgi:hypothetical protein